MTWDLLQQLNVSFFTSAEEIFFSVAEKIRVNPPFRPIWILVPDQGTKNAILEELINSYGLVLLNTTVTTFSNGLACLLKKSSSFDSTLLASKAELAAKLYFLFRQKLQKEIPDHLVAKKASKEASILFSALRYIKKASLKGKTLADWQSLFPNNSFFSDALTSSLSIKKDSLQVLVAGIGELTEEEIIFLKNLSQYVPVEIFAYTSCVMFHQDFLSKHQKKRLLSTLNKKNASASGTKELLYYLEQQNPLLANNGNLQRTLLDKLEDFQPKLFENHPFSSSTPKTLLGHIQQDLLLAKEKEGVQEVQKTHPSLLFLSCTSKREEVEALYHLLENRCMADKSLQPKDILVFSPDLEAYGPYIDAIFTQEESILPYYLELPVPTSSLVEAFLLIAKLPLTRVENKVLLTLLENIHIQQLFAFKKVHIQKCKQWIREGGMRWGWNKEHKKAWIEKTVGENAQIPQEDAGTWGKGKKRLLESLLKLEGKEPSLSVERGDIFQMEAFFQLLDFLEAHCLSVEERPKRSAKEWREYFLSLYEKFFSFSKESGEESLPNSFSAICTNFSEQISYEAFFSLFEQQMQRPPLRKRVNGNTIRFLPMGDEPLYLAKVVCYLGCQEEAFSEDQENCSFLSEELLRLIPKKKQKMRAHFLRSLNLAKEGLYFFSSSEQGHFLPFIQELQEYVKQFYKGETTDCSFSSHWTDKSLADPILGSSFLSDILAVKALQKQKRANFPRVFLHPKKNGSPSFNIGIEDLASFLEHPVKHYIRSKLGLYFGEENPLKEEPPLSLDPLRFWKERENSFEGLLQGKNSSLSDEEATGVFWSAAKQELKEFSWLTANSFKEQFLQKEAFKTLIIGDGEESDAPPFIWEYEGSAVKLTGKIPRYNNGTIVIHSSFSEEKWIKTLPQLAMIHFSKIHHEPRAFFLKDRKTFTFFAESDSYRLLQALLSFYIEGQKRCLPLLPKVALELAFGNLSKAEGNLQKSFHSFFKPDPYMRWAFPEEKAFSLSEYKPLCQPFLHTIFKYYLQAKKRDR